MDTVAELKKIEDQLIASWVFGDPSFHEEILADDWKVIDPSGHVMTKAEMLAVSFVGERDISFSEIDEVDVREYGDLAIVTGRTRVRGSIAGQDVDITLRFTDVFSRTSGRWQCHASQGTFVSEPPA